MAYLYCRHEESFDDTDLTGKNSENVSGSSQEPANKLTSWKCIVNCRTLLAFMCVQVQIMTGLPRWIYVVSNAVFDFCVTLVTVTIIVVLIVLMGPPNVFGEMQNLGMSN